MAATRMPKLKLMLNDESVFMRTVIEVQTVREYLARTDNNPPERPMHPAQILSQKRDEEQSALTQGEEEVGDPRAASSQGSERNEGEAPGSNTQRKQNNLKKVLSHKAIQIGSESGVTAEFIVK